MDVMAHAPMIRNNTSPIFKRDRDRDTKSGSNSISSAPRASQLSGSTAYNSSTQSLASLSSASTAVPSMNGGGGSTVIATANIINQKADASRSLYQICVALRTRLGQVPNFEEHLEQVDQMDPVDSLWAMFKTGYPLLVIYNALQPATPLQIDAANAKAPESKKAKVAVFKFVQACLQELKMAAGDCFVISDLMGNDTSGFVKVTQVVNFVLDIADQRGFLVPLQPYPEDDIVGTTDLKMTYRDHIVKELVDTERKYVQDLENLHDLKKALDQKGAVPGDTVLAIFGNINAILDFQRRFLIRVETTNSMPSPSQMWGGPFVTFEDAFDIYQPFIANQRKAAQTAQQVFDKIKAVDHPVAIDFNTLDGFLLKPMQRLVKYPLLLKDLLKKSEDDHIKNDLAGGIEAAERVLTKANEAVNRDLLDEAVEELKVRVDDWKSHRMDQFGNLLQHGVYTVVTGKTDTEKDYEIYLFETILLCCKEVTANKTKDKKDKTKSTSGPKLRNRNAKLQLKGRIFMTNVTEVVTLSRQGSYNIQIWWKGDPGVENFTIKFTNEEMMKRWAYGLDAQRKMHAPKSTTSPDQPPPAFSWMQTPSGAVNPMENPYLVKEQDQDDDEEYGAPGATQFGPPSAGGPMLARNASSTSLRGRSATGDSTQSLAGAIRGPPPRFPMNPPAPLSLQTQAMGGRVGAPSPGERNIGDSYFSPVGDSPVSSRTSTASGMIMTPGYPFPKTNTPQPQYEDPVTGQRYTAPAIPRAPSRDGPSPNPYGMGGRNPRGPSLPAMSSQSSAQQQRSRSYSTPDINGQPNARRNTAGTPGMTGVPTVPSIPAHLHHDHNIPRSQAGSPRQDLPIRANTQSPGVQRERLHQHQASGSFGGTMSQFPANPIYSRQPTPSLQQQQQMGGIAGVGSLGDGGAAGRTTSPPIGSLTPQMLTSSEMPQPTQLKVKVVCDGGNYFTLVAAFNITYQTLVDRIDAKLSRFTKSSIGKGMLKLRYRDEDGDFVSVESDDDIQIAFMEWREGARNMYPGGVGEIELFCVGDTA